MPAKDPLVYVMHIRGCCRRIVEYSATWHFAYAKASPM
jgi:hypothetical protein